MEAPLIRQRITARGPDIKCSGTGLAFGDADRLVGYAWRNFVIEDGDSRCIWIAHRGPARVAEVNQEIALSLMDGVIENRHGERCWRCLSVSPHEHA